jgi:hypothetical protein
MESNANSIIGRTGPEQGNGAGSVRRYQAPWGRLLVWTTALCTVLCVGLPIGLVWFLPKPTGGLPPWVHLTQLLPILVIPIGSLFMIRGYTVTDDAILVHRLLWTTRVPLAALTAVSYEPEVARGSLRTCGNGGLFSFTGWFRNQRLGSYRAFMTDTHRTVVLRFGKKTIVMSPASPEDFVRDLEHRSAKV